MARQFRGRGGLQAPKRQIANDGVDAINATLLTMGAANIQSIGLGSLELTVPAATLVRTRGSFSVRWRVSGASNNRGNGAFGMIVASNEAVGVGLSALPSPLTEIENDWFVYVPFTLIKSATAVEVNDLATVQHIPFDSRGMRKLKLGESLVGVVEFTQVNGTTGSLLDVAAQFRVQLKL